MSNVIGNMLIKVGADISGAVGDLDGLVAKIEATGESMKNIGKKATVGITAPLVAAGVASVKAATDLNRGLANVQSLGVTTERVEELRGAVQDMAVDVGKGTDDLTGGLYQVVSAFGDTADTVAILDINARAATAGLATTEQAIALTSAVTKGYGDTSAEAVQKASDLAFMTVQLGQTTFPELASSMGRVVPLAASLGVSQETLAAQFATLTGVTGSTAEVSTQLRATYQSLLKPTGEMASAINSVAFELESSGQLVQNDQVGAWQELRQKLSEATTEHYRLTEAMAEMEASGQDGTAAYAQFAERTEYLGEVQEELATSIEESAAGLGQSIVESVGMTDALSLLAGEADGNSNVLGQMFGSVEALNAVLALSGPQADTFATKLAAMQDATGASGDAFAAQTEGVNSSEFALAQLQQQLTTVGQQLGEALLPALTSTLEALTPFIDGIAGLAQKFAELDPEQQKMILAAVGILAAIGPVATVLGSVMSVASLLAPILTAVGTALGVITSPAWLVGIAIAGVVAVLADLFTGGEAIPGMLDKLGFAGAADAVRGFYDGIVDAKDAVATWTADTFSFDEVVFPETITKLVDWAWPILASIDWVDLLLKWAWPVLVVPSIITELVKWAWPDLELPGIVDDLLDWDWPTLSAPDWVTRLLNWTGGGGDAEGDDGGGGVWPFNALGTSYWGGGLTMVGETGPELVHLPRGAAVYPSAATADMMSNSGMISITINNPVVRSDRDIHDLANAVGRELKRRARA